MKGEGTEGEGKKKWQKNGIEKRAKERERRGEKLKRSR